MPIRGYFLNDRPSQIHLRRLLPKNAFARGVSVLVGGTAGAQLLTILAAPLLTRLYGPEDFGLVAVNGSGADAMDKRFD